VEEVGFRVRFPATQDYFWITFLCRARSGQVAEMLLYGSFDSEASAIGGGSSRTPRHTCKGTTVKLSRARHREKRSGKDGVVHVTVTVPHAAAGLLCYQFAT